MINWLSKRLTSAKSKESRWASFASVLEAVWEEFFDPRLSRLERLRSSYLADDADLAKKIREMGDYFTYDMPKEEDRPVAVAWRRLELQNKDMELILKSVFRRHFGHLPVTWFPLFAPLSRAYGFLFEPYGGLGDDPLKNQPPEGMFLTSRGMLGVDKDALHRIGLNTLSFMDKARPLAVRTKPLHIVFDGFIWYIRFDLPFEVLFSAAGDSEDFFQLLFAPMGTRFDHIPADCKPLDSAQGLGFSRDTERDLRCIPFIPHYSSLWRLDMRLPEGLPEGWLPLDCMIPGHEGMNVSPLGVALGESITPFFLTMSTTDTEAIREKSGLPITSAQFQINSSIMGRDAGRRCSMMFDYPGTNQYPLFDEIPADFMSLDLPYGGYANA